MQPVQLASNTKSGLIQMPNAAFSELGQNVFDDDTQSTRCAVHPVGHAGRAQAGGTKQITQKLGRRAERNGEVS